MEVETHGVSGFAVLLLYVIWVEVERIYRMGVE